jgi:xylose isomerase
MQVQRRRYAARLNAFKIGADKYWPGKNRITTIDLLERASKVNGLNAADLNYPDHFEGTSAKEMHTAMDSIDMTKRGIDTVSQMGGSLMTLWMGQDGFDYSFQGQYARMWDDTIDAMQQVASHNADIQIAIEYKPNEPRSYALMPDVGTTLLAIREAGNANLGVTLDFAHVLYADEMPAHAAHLVSRHSKLLGVHLNDGYGKRDDGLMVGTVHPVQTLELLVELERTGYEGAIYFDTFPDHSGLDPQQEARTNIAIVERLQAIATGLAHDTDLARAIASQDATVSQRIVAAALYGIEGKS